MHNTKHSKDLLKKAAVAVLLVVVMAGVSFFGCEFGTQK